jgi:hypothetical protein
MVVFRHAVHELQRLEVSGPPRPGGHGLRCKIGVTVRGLMIRSVNLEMRDRFEIGL